MDNRCPVKARQGADRKFNISVQSEGYLRKIRQLQFGRVTDPMVISEKRWGNRSAPGAPVITRP